MDFVDRAKGLLRSLVLRLVLLLAGCLVLFVSMRVNLDTGREVIAGLISPASPSDVAVSVARLAAPALGLVLIYRALR